MNVPGGRTLAPSTVELLERQGLDVDDVVRVVATALEEDLRLGPDVTTLSTVGPTARATGSVVPRESGVLAGLGVAVAVLDLVLGEDRDLVHLGADGDRAVPGEPALVVTAPVAGLLTAERTVLNLLCHLSGVATATDAWVRAAAGTRCRIRDTRKTLPGLRQLQKYAVRTGGGVNHRMALGDAALIKDNHVVAAGGVVEAMRLVRAAAPGLHCEVEVDSLDQLDAVLAEGAELVLLDNFDVPSTAEAVRRRDAVAPGTGLESSGGLTLAVAGDYARTGVDFVAVGALTHSVTVLDLGLDLD
jgi:nicotinate-nucleotide pyrophosphorylase (carboxylating)